MGCGSVGRDGDRLGSRAGRGIHAAEDLGEFADAGYIKPLDDLVGAPDIGADTPAPRTQGDMLAMRAAYTSGMVFGGHIPLPTIDHRQYMERELDMHNSHQSFAVRQRVLEKMGRADHLVIWFTDTMPGQPKASQSMEAIAVMDEWMANIRANPKKGIARNRPARAVDSCQLSCGTQADALPSLGFTKSWLSV